MQDPGQNLLIQMTPSVIQERYLYGKRAQGDIQLMRQIVKDRRVAKRIWRKKAVPLTASHK